MQRRLLVRVSSSFVALGKTLIRSISARDNVTNVAGMYMTPNPANTASALSRCGKFLERKVLQEIGYPNAGVLEQIASESTSTLV